MDTWELLSWLWRASWQASVLVLLVWGVQSIFRKRLTPQWRYALWFLVLGRLVLPIAPESPFSIFNLARLDGDAAFSWRAAPADPATASAASASVRTTLPESPLASQSADTAVVPTGSAFPTIFFAGNESVGWNLGLTVGIVWLAGALFFSIRLGRGSLRLSRHLRDRQPLSDPAVLRLLEQCGEEMQVRRQPVLIETPEVDSPALFGFFRPKLLLPEGLLQRFSHPDLRYVFLHELAHLRRGDVAVNRLAAILQIIHWFNPVLWLGFRRMRADRELACDALVLSRTGHGENIGYGETLLRLLAGPTRPSPLPALIGMVDSKKQVPTRIRLIAQFRENRGWPVLPLLLAAALAVGGLTDGLSRASTAPEPTPPDAAETLARAAAADFTLLDLTLDYDLLEDERSQFGTWEVVPKGLQVLDGVPFDTGGMIRLFGVIPPPHGTVYRNEVVEIPVGRSFEQLHLLHGTGWTTEDGVTIARLIIHYADGWAASFPIVYGEHVRDWWHRDFSVPSDVTDPQSDVAWTGEHNGLGLRFYRTSFTNPFPEKEVATIDLISERSAVTPAILAITVGDAVAATPAQSWDANWAHAGETQALLFRVIDRKTGRGIPNAGLHVGYCGNLACGYGGSFLTGPDGTREVAYPRSEFLEGLSISVHYGNGKVQTVSWNLLEGDTIPATHTLAVE